jgi:alkylation response protein AidB-like acyl-CoA dehydrogenase
MSRAAEKSLQSAAGDLELAEAALNAAADLVRTHDAAREIAADRGGAGEPSVQSAPHAIPLRSAANDPHTLLRFGQLRARLHAAHGLLSRAVRLREHAKSTDSEDTLATIVALQAQAFARDVTLEINNELTVFGGIATIDWQSRGAQPPTVEQPNHLAYERIGRYYLQAELTASNDAFSTDRFS